MENIFEYPFKAKELFTQRKSLKRSLLTKLKSENEKKLKIAVLGGSTTSDLVQVIELFFLNSGITVEFFETDYNRYAEVVLFDSSELWNFQPDIIYIHTTVRNINFSENPEVIFSKYEEIWKSIRSKSSALIIQNNFELSPVRALGNLEATNEFGFTKLINALNEKISNFASRNSSFYINDINYLSSFFGLSKWFDSTFWNNYKIPYSVEATPFVAQSLLSIVKAHKGKSKKCLVLDLDNTLWGGVVGDDGLRGIAIGEGDARGEAYLSFQKYVKRLKQRGVILAICSKNDFETAKTGFSHPDSYLKFEDFSSFQASWDLKTDGLKKISKELNIGLDSLVFVDDNPAERELIRAQLPEVAVPEVGVDVTEYSTCIDLNGYFESVKILKEDLEKINFYAENKMRVIGESQFENYHDFLVSLNMVAEISTFSVMYQDRITQLINKTNQFNLTTKTICAEEVNSRMTNSKFINLYGRLFDKFGDNGLVSLISGEKQDKVIEIDIWVMSCRVFKRDLELAIFDEFVSECILQGLETIKGIYKKSAKNNIVAELYSELGFEKQSETEWVLKNLKSYKKLNTVMRIDR